MRKAVIDLGTNTFNLLIGELRDEKLEVLHAARIPVLIGMGGINQGVITEASLERAMKALRQFRDTALEFDVVSIIGFGTSAIRDASNKQQLIHRAKVELGIEIHVISGIQEAELIYKGVNWLYDFQESAVIMDIGGGSTEFINADTSGVRKVCSLDIGVSRVYQFLGGPRDYTSEDRQLIRDFFSKKGAELQKVSGSEVLIGASGSFETFYEMIHERPFSAHSSITELPIEPLKAVLNWAVRASFQEREDHPWIIDIRKTMLPIAALKVLWVLEELKITRVLVSPYSLKEGGFGY